MEMTFVHPLVRYPRLFCSRAQHVYLFGCFDDRREDMAESGEENSRKYARAREHGSTIHEDYRFGCTAGMTALNVNVFNHRSKTRGRLANLPWSATTLCKMGAQVAAVRREPRQQRGWTDSGLFSSLWLWLPSPPRTPRQTFLARQAFHHYPLHLIAIF
jgi:hypothetical protein